MSDYAYVADRAKKAFASVARLEDALAKSPDDRVLQINLKSMLHRAEQAREEMERIAALNAIEVCRYRIIPFEGFDYFLEHVSSSLLHYQYMFSQIYDAHKNGPKTRAHVGSEAKKESALNFGFSYSGSLGVSLLIRSNRDFFSGNLDSSIETVYQILEISEIDDVKDVANTLGRAVIKRVHDWSLANISGGFSADIQWKRSDGKSLGRVIDLSDLEKIVEIIDSTSDKITNRVRETGMLVGGNVSSHSFHFVVPDGESYVGHIDDDAELPELILGRIYEAEIEIEEVYYYATEKHEKTNTLKKLVLAG